jgi:hypothetical protein
MSLDPLKKSSRKTQSGKKNPNPESVTIEHLTNTQIVLLTFLVAFVTSIVTGITVVTLMDQEPQAVSQTINRIVQRTIERVIPSETKTEPKTEVVVLNAEEEHLAMIAKASKNIGIASSENKNDAGDTIKFSLGSGYFISNDYFIIPGIDATDNKTNITINYNGNAYEAIFVGYSDTNFSLLKLKENTDLPKLDISAPEYVDTASLKPGESVILVYGTPYSVTNGIISSVTEYKDNKGSYEILIDRSKIKDDTGAVVMNSSGKCVGFVSESDIGSATVVDNKAVQNEIEKLKTI